MSKMKTFYTLILLSLAGVCLLAGACNNGPSETAAAGKEDSLSAPGWTMGIALYSFNKHPYAAALEKVDSAGVKNVEGFSFYMLGKEFGDSTMSALSPA